MGKTKRQGGKRPRGKKHPHARGEDPHSGVPRIADWETPPRTWGRPVPGGAETLPVGNTPTHVGKTKKSPGFFRGPRKHPHARGEDRGRSNPALLLPETPPRTWGRRELAPSPVACLGNTPTHVGKTSVRELAGLIFRKHPHARGEDHDPQRHVLFQIETPPRTWGRRFCPLPCPPRSRNTPTHVGKTPEGEDKIGIAWKHPHARGEDKPNRPLPALQRETPPRTWGRPASVSSRASSSGNTPTHVGKTTILNVMSSFK